MFDPTQTEFFYFVYRHMDHTFAVERSRVNFTDLTYLISGEMIYRYNGEEVRLHAGDAILFPQGSLRERLETPMPVRYASINVRFRDGFVSPLAGVLPEQTTAEVLPILKAMNTAWHSASEYAERQCLSLFSYLYYRLAATGLECQNPYIRQMRAYISEHLSEKLTLGEIADSVHLTSEYCCSLFKKHMGKTVFDYILAQRIDTAKRLITLGDLSLRSVAAEIGFTDYNYFSRTFKRLCGMTPGEYRKAAVSGIELS